MTDFARLVLDADTRGLKTAERDLKGVNTQAAATARDVDNAAGKMGSAFKKIGVALVAAGIADVVFQFGKASAQAAIDAQEMESAFNVVFGNMAGDVRAWAEATGNELGRSTQEIQRAALAFQELFGQALAPEQAATLSQQFAVLTQDLASFKNLSNEVAQQKLFSGLVGEAEPLRAVGVFLNETAVQAKAAELGLAGVNGVLTDQEKIVARAALIQEQLANAQGDVERTSGSTANQIKTMNAAVEELQVAIGSKLLPQLTPLISLTAQIITHMADAAQKINVTTESAANMARGLEIVFGAIGRGISALSGFASWLGLTSARLDQIGNAARIAANPVFALLGVLERVGAASNAAERAASNRDAVGLGAKLPDLRSVLPEAFTAQAPKTIATLGAINTGIGNVGRSTGSSAAIARVATDDFADLMENLFPESITRRQREQLALIDKYKDKIFDVAEARRRALGIDGEAFVSDQILNAEPIDTTSVTNAAKTIMDELESVANGSKKQSTVITQTFAQLAESVTNSLQGLASSIKSGDFFGILQGVIGLFSQLGGAGLFGSGIQNFFNQPVAGARANGGSVAAGSTYLVGERGPELFEAPGAGRIRPNGSFGGATQVMVGIDPRNGNVTAYITDQIAASAPLIANAGAGIAQAQAGKSSSRRFR